MKMLHKMCYLDNLGRWVIKVIMGLIVLVPLKAGVNSVEVTGLSRPVLVTPVVALLQHRLHGELGLVLSHALPCLRLHVPLLLGALPFHLLTSQCFPLIEVPLGNVLLLHVGHCPLF